MRIFDADEIDMQTLIIETEIVTVDRNYGERYYSGDEFMSVYGYYVADDELLDDCDEILDRVAFESWNDEMSDERCEIPNLIPFETWHAELEEHEH